MNTLFPGSKDGTVGGTQQQKVMKGHRGADICVDVHSSSVSCKEIPQVRSWNSDGNGSCSVCCVHECWMLCGHIKIVYGHGGSLALPHRIGVKSMVSGVGVALKMECDYSNQIVDGLHSLL